MVWKYENMFMYSPNEVSCWNQWSEAHRCRFFALGRLLTASHTDCTVALLSMTDDKKLPGYWQTCYTRLGRMLLTELSTLSYWGVSFLLQFNPFFSLSPISSCQLFIVQPCLIVCVKSKACMLLKEMLERCFFLLVILAFTVGLPSRIHSNNTGRFKKKKNLDRKLC